MRDCWLASRNHRDRAVCGASTQHMADHLRSLHAQELQADGGGDTHLTKKQCLPSENEKDLQCEQHHQASHESGAGVPQASDMANETSNQYDSMTQTAQAGFYMLETRVSVTDAKIDELTQAGELLLDRLKAAFISKMQEYKQHVHSYAETEAQKWAEQSAATQQAGERLHTAKQLVSTLRLRVESSLPD